VFLGIGGTENDFRTIAGDATKLGVVVNGISTFASNLGFDGVDIDWEFPESDGDEVRVVNMLNSFRSALNQWSKPGLIAVEVRYDGGSPGWNPQGYTLDNLKLPDLLNMMCYDLNWPAGQYPDSFPATWGSPLHDPGSPCTGDSMIPHCQDWLGSGVDTTKMAVGIGFYGWKYSGINAPCLTHYDWEISEFGQWQALLNGGATENWDDNAHCPWLSGSDSNGPYVILYDNLKSIGEKAAWARDTRVNGNSFGGMMVWTMGMGRETPTSDQVLLQTLASEYWK